MARAECDNKKVHILVVDDDSVCLLIVGAMLKTCKFNVLVAKHGEDALEVLRTVDGQVDIVLTDVYMPVMNGFELQKHINEEFKIPVVMMSADDGSDTMLRGLMRGAAKFLIKPAQIDDLQKLGRYARPRTPSSTGVVVPNKRPFFEKGTISHLDANVEGAGEKRTEWKRKMPRKVQDCGEDAGSSSSGTNLKRKPKMVWSAWLHTLFIIAINAIGFENCVPKKIMEYMRVPGLTRENVASHLQKYRIFLRRAVLRKELAAAQSRMSLCDKIKYRSGFASANICLNTYQSRYIEHYQDKQRQRAEKIKADEKLRAHFKYGTSGLSLNDICTPPNSGFGSNRVYNTRASGDIASNFMTNVGVNGLNAYQPQAKETKPDFYMSGSKNVTLSLKDLQFLSRDPAKFKMWQEAHCNVNNGEAQVARYDSLFCDNQTGGNNYFIGESSTRLGGDYVPNHVQPILPMVPPQPAVQASPAPAVPYMHPRNESHGKAPLVENPTSAHLWPLDSSALQTSFGLGGDDTDDFATFAYNAMMTPRLETTIDEIFMQHVLEDSGNQPGEGKGQEVAENARETVLENTEGTQPLNIQATGNQQGLNEARSPNDNTWDSDDGFLEWLDRAGPDDDEMNELMFDMDADGFGDEN